jgi:hypothetical protein
MRKALLWLLAAGCCAGSYATDARVIAMGRHDAFFMDEVSIFRNPANINVYPNMVYGSYGVYNGDTSASAKQNTEALARYNQNPVDPFFGAIVSYSVNQNQSNDGGSNQYPMLSFGAYFNRHDEILDYVTKGSNKYIGAFSDTLENPLLRSDLMLGYTLSNGSMIGAGAYIAMQRNTVGGELYETNLIKGNLGVNLPIAKSMDLEGSVGFGTITAIGRGVDGTVTRADGDYFGRAELRLFSALAALNGDFVPHIKGEMLKLDQENVFKFDMEAGIGININIDKGFFWSGLEFLYNQEDSSATTATESVGGRISFGIERSIWWDWLVIRVGGQKEFRYVSQGPDNGHFVENPTSDGSDGDLVGLGFGVNIENRLRVDVVAAEDIPYTFTNLISGPQHHLFNRVSATYSF